MYNPRAEILANRYKGCRYATKTDIVCWIADDLKVSISTVYSWLHQGKFKIEPYEKPKK